jgi:hypothetical protein
VRVIDVVARPIGRITGAVSNSKVFVAASIVAVPENRFIPTSRVRKSASEGPPGTPGTKLLGRGPSTDSSYEMGVADAAEPMNVVITAVRLRMNNAVRFTKSIPPFPARA